MAEPVMFKLTPAAVETVCVVLLNAIEAPLAAVPAEEMFTAAVRLPILAALNDWLPVNDRVAGVTTPAFTLI